MALWACRLMLHFSMKRSKTTAREGRNCIWRNQRGYQVLVYRCSTNVTTGISQLPRRDRANKMSFNCTLLTVARRSPSSISVHHFRKTLSFLSHFHKLCNKKTITVGRSVLRNVIRACQLVSLVKWDLLFGCNFLAIDETSRRASTFHSSAAARSIETGEGTKRSKVSCGAGVIHYTIER